MFNGSLTWLQFLGDQCVSDIASFLWQARHLGNLKHCVYPSILTNLYSCPYNIIADTYLRYMELSSELYFSKYYLKIRIIIHLDYFAMQRYSATKNIDHGVTVSLCSCSEVRLGLQWAWCVLPYGRKQLTGTWYALLNRPLWQSRTEESMHAVSHAV